uniref:Chemokine interleukin-8-like domain-containing protein n=1 Tax=Denticeps clupeoides TaxID=299321 RepID=A0AAY4BPC6_9TELE
MNPPPATAALLLSALVLCATSRTLLIVLPAACTDAVKRVRYFTRNLFCAAENALRCQCPKVVDEKPRNIERAVKSISRLPAGPHCRNEQVCFSPAAPWVKELEAK